jgi:hypothetical protein
MNKKRVRVILRHHYWAEHNAQVDYDTVIIRIGRTELEWTGRSYNDPGKSRSPGARACANRVAKALKVKVETEET